MLLDFSSISRQSLFGRLARRSLGLIPRGTTLRVIQGPLKGMRWIAGFSTHGCWTGSYELRKQKEFQRRVREGFIVCDIGANVGFYTLLGAVLTGERGHIYSFEPRPRNVEILVRHLSMNQIENATVFSAALSDSRSMHLSPSDGIPVRAALPEVD